MIIERTRRRNEAEMEFMGVIRSKIFWLPDSLMNN